MNRYVLDTDTVVLFQEGNAAVCRRVLARPIDELAISVISVEEQLSGWYTMVRRAKNATALARAYQHLADCVSMLSHFRILPFTESAIEKYEQLAKQKLGVKHMDLRIAAIAIEHAATLVTRNRRDFERVDGLLIEDWAESAKVDW
jgi:tRNA(fMet)-specific endonuclease VapC